MAKLHTLTDYGKAATIAALWTTANSLGTPVPTATASGLSFAPPSATAGTNYPVLDSVTTYDLTGSHGFVHVSSMVIANANLEAAPIELKVDSNNNYRWRYSNGTLAAQKKVGGVSSDLYTATWSLTTHAWLRIRESGGTVYFDTSTDGITWTNRATNASSAFAITACTFEVFAGTLASVSNPGALVVDSINGAPARRVTEVVPTIRRVTVEWS